MAKGGGRRAHTLYSNLQCNTQRHKIVHTYDIIRHIGVCSCRVRTSTLLTVSVWTVRASTAIWLQYIGVPQRPEKPHLDGATDGATRPHINSPSPRCGRGGERSGRALEPSSQATLPFATHLCHASRAQCSLLLLCSRAKAYVLDGIVHLKKPRGHAPWPPARAARATSGPLPWRMGPLVLNARGGASQSHHSLCSRHCSCLACLYRLP